jgi:multidrug efflux system membrane fusion protein
MVLPSYQETPRDPNRQGAGDEKRGLHPVASPDRRRWRIPSWLLGACALVVALAGFWFFNHHGKEVAGGMAVLPVSVRVATVRQGDMAVVERTIGTVVSDATVQVTAMVAGPLERAYFKEGQMVRRGDPLFLIDPRSYQAALDQARGQMSKDEATLAGAERDLARYQALMHAHAGTQQILEDQEATVASDRGVVESDKANVATASINLGYTLIRSPIDGKTGPILIQPGNVISVTGITASTAPLVTITQVHPIKVSFSLPQSDLPRIQARQRGKGLVATIDLRNSGGRELVAPVNFIGNVVNGQTGTVELRVTLANGDATLVPGQIVDVAVELNKISRTIIVPHEAVNDGPAGHYVFTVADGRAKLRPVKVLFDDSRNVAVDGELKAGEKVVVDGQLRVVPGGPLSIDSSPGYAPSAQGSAITSVPE